MESLQKVHLLQASHFFAAKNSPSGPSHPVCCQIVSEKSKKPVSAYNNMGFFLLRY
jgi:hypothetical protein